MVRKWDDNRKRVFLGITAAVVLLLVVGGVLLAGDIIRNTGWKNESRARRRTPHLVIWDAEDVMYVDSSENPIIASKYHLTHVREDFGAFLYQIDMMKYYSVDGEEGQLAEGAKIWDVTGDFHRIVYTAGGSALYVRTIGDGVRTVDMGEPVSGYTHVVLSKSGRYLAVSAKNAENIRGLYVVDLKKNAVRKIQEDTEDVDGLFVNDRGTLMYMNNEAQLYYDDGKKHVQAADRVAAAVVYEAQEKIIYRDESGKVFVKSTRSARSPECIDTKVDSLYAIGRLNDTQGWDKGADSERDAIYDVTEVKQFQTVIDTGVNGILYTKAGVTRYYGFGESATVPFMDVNAAALYCCFFAPDGAYCYSGADGKVYQLKRTEDAWEARYVCHGYAISTRDLFDQGNGTTYRAPGESETVTTTVQGVEISREIWYFDAYAWADGREILLTEKADYVMGAISGSEIYYTCGSKLYMRKDFTKDPVLLADDVNYVPGTSGMRYVRPVYWEGAVYYSNKQGQLMKVAIDGSEKEVVLESVSDLRIYWSD